MASELNGNDVAFKHLKSVKSAYILEADALMARGLEAAGMALFVKAAELELQLADLFQSRSEQANADISRFSSASCLFRARQFRRASGLFARLQASFPEAQALIAQCEGKDDIDLSAATPGLQALIGLLVKKNVINEAEWAGALTAH